MVETPWQQLLWDALGRGGGAPEGEAKTKSAPCYHGLLHTFCWVSTFGRIAWSCAASSSKSTLCPYVALRYSPEASTSQRRL